MHYTERKGSLFSICQPDDAQWDDVMSTDAVSPECQLLSIAERVHFPFLNITFSSFLFCIFVSPSRNSIQSHTHFITML